MIVTLTLTFMLVSIATSVSIGPCDNTDNEWAFHWYLDDPINMCCNAPNLNVQSSDHVVWEAPSKQKIQNSTLDDSYTLFNLNGTRDGMLRINKVRPEVHGVYICRVFMVNSTMRSRMIFALNIHEEKFRHFLDRYRHSLIVAVITVVVFLVPMATMCTVYHFQYRSQEEKENKANRRERRYAKYADIHMKSTEKALDDTKGQNENGAYDNQNFVNTAM